MLALVSKENLFAVDAAAFYGMDALPVTESTLYLLVL